MTTTTVAVRPDDYRVARNLAEAEAGIRHTRALLAQHIGWELVAANKLVQGDEVHLGDKWQTVTGLRLVDYEGTVGVEVRTPGACHVVVFGDLVVRITPQPF